MDQVIGFIGGGNMGAAMIGGIVKAGLVPADRILVSDVNEDLLAGLQQEHGVSVTTDNVAVAKQAGVLFLAVKPFLYQTVIEEIADVLSKDTLVVAIAAGFTLAQLEQMLGEGQKVFRTMPNTPALVGMGMSAVCKNTQVTQAELDVVLTIFASFGKVEEVPEGLMNTVIGVSGSSPAYVYLFIEAMADAAVAGGMPRAQAYTFAAQSVAGAAEMVLQTGIHPAQLKDMVCTPGGTTIDAVLELEQKGLRTAVQSAMRSCIEKAEQLSKGQ